MVVPAESVSVRVHAEYALFAPRKAISPPSDPCIWYPPAIAVCTASWIVIGYSLWSISLPFLRQPHAMMARTAYHCERDERPVSLPLVPRESPSRYTAACLSASTQRSRMVVHWRLCRARAVPSQGRGASACAAEGLVGRARRGGWANLPCMLHCPPSPRSCGVARVPRRDDEAPPGTPSVLAEGDAHG